MGSVETWKVLHECPRCTECTPMGAFPFVRLIGFSRASTESRTGIVPSSFLARAKRTRGGRKEMKKIIGFAALLMATCAAIGAAATKCRYCGYTSYGSCSNSPHGKHEHVDTSERCEFCGYTSYGNCSYSPSGKHRHGHGDGKCIWCGYKTNGGNCSYSPHGKHEL